jgi:hypothetical protein
VLAQRKQRKFHWSGKTRTQLDREVFTSGGVYKVLSWEAHAVMGPIRDLHIEMTTDGARFNFGRKPDDPLVDAEHIAYATGGMLFFMYADYAHAWGLPTVTPPAAA